MDYLAAAAAAAIALGAGWFAAANQHRLYREPEFRANPATGRRGRFLRGGVAMSAALIATLAFRPDHYSFVPAFLTAVFGLALAVLASTDFERRRVPNRLIYPAIVLAVAFAWAWPDRDAIDIALGLLAAAALAAVLLGLGVLVGRDLLGFGAGDLKLILLAGLLLGWPLLIPALAIGVLLAGIPAVVMIVSGRGRERYAYGPYLCAGTIAVMLFPDTFAF